MKSSQDWRSQSTSAKQIFDAFNCRIIKKLAEEIEATCGHDAIEDAIEIARKRIRTIAWELQQADAKVSRNLPRSLANVAGIDSELMIEAFRRTQADVVIEVLKEFLLANRRQRGAK